MEDFEVVFDKLKDQAEKDLSTNKDIESITNFLFTSGIKMHKYSKLLARFTKAYYELENDLNIKYKELYMYYKVDFDIKLEKNELKMFIISDLEYINIQKNIQQYKILIEYIERTLKELESMNWNLKNAIEYSKLTGNII